MCKPCKEWGKLPINWCRISEPSTVLVVVLQNLAMIISSALVGGKLLYSSQFKGEFDSHCAIFFSGYDGMDLAIKNIENTIP